MNPPPVQPQAGLWRRWGSLVTFVFIVQLALIFWLSDPAPLRRRPPHPAPVLHLTGGRTAELLALQDPTLFARPHPQGFSGLAWLRVPPATSPPFDWVAPTNDWLELPAQDLGAVFTRFIETNTLGLLPTPAMPPPDPALPQSPVLPLGPAHSVAHIEGDLATRRLLSPLALSPWAHSEMLTNTVLQLLVDAQGRPLSVALLTSSGSKAADGQALEQARNARFEPLAPNRPERPPRANPPVYPTWGELIVEWQTLPLTNSPPN